MEVTRIFDILPNYLEKYPDQKVALAGKPNGTTGWIKYSIQDYIEHVNYLSYALIKLGIQKNDKVAIISGNRPEWNMLDMAIMQVGAITVPVYPTISENDYHYILNNCEAKMAVIEGAEVMNKIDRIMPDTPNLTLVYTFINRNRFQYFDQLLELGAQNICVEELEKRKAAVDGKECATIIYTSGTTGTPKGVMLSHSNILHQIFNLQQTPAKTSKTAFSFLPLCHSYERTLVFMYQYLGMSVYYAQNLGTIATDLKEVHPTMMTAVPRVLEKFYDKIYTSGAKQPFLKRKIFYWALKVRRQYKIIDEERTWCYNIKYNIANKLVFKKIKEGIGGNFDIVVSGAASIQPRLASFFSAIGMPVYEGYGMTEASPVIATSCRDKYGRESGTVGFPLPGVEVAISKCGEVICRGHNVMMGYYKDEALTKEVIDEDGWLHTGDLGKFTDKGQLVLTGRKKNLFKTSFGKYVNPQVIEEKFSESPFIENVVVVGENQKFAAALISPDFNFLKGWCERHDLVYTTPEQIVKEPKVLQRFAREVEKYNAFFGDTEKVKKYELIPDEWSQMTDILTPTLKVKRKMVMERYKENINNLFGIKENEGN
ncbi:MAG: long-chain fatty acid--CoA ligase [Bacteroidales bacterium]|nr:long-chain fatty acid--CoA ligase [Bacteroidales bacterium]